MAAQKDFQDGVIANFKKLEEDLKQVNLKLDTLNNQDVTNLKLQVARLETRLAMVMGILGPIGLAALGLGIKAVFGK